MGKDKPASETDEGSDHSSGDDCRAMGVDSSDHGPAKGVDFPSRVNTLKPQIDKIFSDVQKQLPDIDFESSGNQSDEEPIFCPHLTGARDVFDDDKDLDTSSRLEDYHLHGSPEISPLQSPEKNKNVSAVTEEDSELFDNDLAAFRSTMAFPTESDIQKWRILTQSVEDSACQLEAREEADLRRARVLRHATEAERSAEKSSATQDAASEAKTSETGNSTNFRIRDNSDIDLVGDPGDNTLVPETVKKFHLRLQEGLKAMDLLEPHKTFAKEARNKVDDIMSRFRLQEKIILSREHFEELNLDLVLDAAHEENNPVSLQTPSQSSGQRSSSPVGSGDKETIIDAPEELTLIQKLANLTMKIGGNVEALKSLDPHTGAAKTGPGIKADKSLVSDNRNIADGSQISDTGCQASDTSTACAGTSTSRDAMKPDQPSRHLKPEEADSESQRVHLNIQISERILEDKKVASETTRILLKLPKGQSKESSSSDEEMDNRNDRDNWHLTRQKMKKLLNQERRKVDTAHCASVSKEDIVYDTSVIKEDLVHSETETKKCQARRFYPVDIKKTI